MRTVAEGSVEDIEDLSRHQKALIINSHRYLYVKLLAVKPPLLCWGGVDLTTRRMKHENETSSWMHSGFCVDSETN
jgi:hypothetical protein